MKLQYPSSTQQDMCTQSRALGGIQTHMKGVVSSVHSHSRGCLHDSTMAHTPRPLCIHKQLNHSPLTRPEQGMRAAASTRVVQTHHRTLGMVSCVQFWFQPGACAPCWSPVARSEGTQGHPETPKHMPTPGGRTLMHRGEAPGVCRGVCCSISPQAGHVSGVRGCAYAPKLRIFHVLRA